jgi:SSS family solute:Na+ symporter
VQYLNLLDYSIIGIYFAILVWMGLYLKNMASASLEDYFLGGRKLPWWALGICGMANFLDMTGTMLIVSFLFMLGPKGLFIEFRGGACLVLAVTMVWTGKWHRRSKCITGAEWMLYRFGNGLGGQFAQFFATVAIVVSTIGMLAYLIKGAGLFLSMFIPVTPFWCAAIMIAITTLYTITSGFYGVVFTDLFQAGIILCATIIISAIAFVKIGGTSNFAQIAASVTGSSDWMNSAPQWIAQMPKGYEAYRHLMLFSFFYLVRNVFGGMGLGNEPRYFGAKNDRECGSLSFLWMFLLMFRWPMMIAFAGLGILMVYNTFPDQTALTQAAEIIKANFSNVSGHQWPDLLAGIIHSPDKFPQITQQLQSLLGSDWQQKIPLLSFNGTVNTERILPAVIIYNIPMGLRGLIVVALIAASMSTFDASLNMATGFFTRDVYQKFKPNASNKELITASWLFGIAVVIVSFIFAYAIPSINSIWGWITMGLGGGLLVPTVLRLYWSRFNGGGFTIGTIVGLIAAVFNQQIWTLLNKVVDLGELNDWKMFVLLFVIGTGASIIGTYLTKPTDRKIVEHFYKTTKPFGLWGDFKKLLDENTLKIMNKEHRCDLLALPFVLGWQITLFLVPMQFIIGNMKDFWFTLSIAGLCLAGVYLFWYRNLPKENYYAE